MDTKRYKIYLSRPTPDMEKHYEVIKHLATECGHTIISHEGRGPFTHGDAERIAESIRQCDIFVLLAGVRYGEIVDQQTGKSLQRLEYILARDSRLPILGLIPTRQNFEKEKGVLKPGTHEYKHIDDQRMFLNFVADDIMDKRKSILITYHSDISAFTNQITPFDRLINQMVAPDRLSESNMLMEDSLLKEPRMERSAPAPSMEAPPPEKFDEVAPRVYPVWYGTNRMPVDPNNPGEGYSSERDRLVHYGVCAVSIPKSHKIGSIGSSWLRRFITGKDDRLKIHSRNPLTEDHFWQTITVMLGACEIGDREALVFIHGYNVTFDEAAIRAAQIGFDLKIPGITAFFSWPSKGGFDDYIGDEATIGASEHYITEFLIKIADVAEVERVHVIAHSMGNRALLQAMKDITYRAAAATQKQFGQIIMAAPDVDADRFKTIIKAHQALAQRTTLYASPRDKALWLSGNIHDYERAGFSPPITIVDGLDTVEVLNSDLMSLGHGYYANARPILTDMHDLIYHNTPPAKRIGLTRADTREGVYWKIGM